MGIRRYLSVCWAVFLALCPFAAASPVAAPAVLVVHSYHVGMPWVDGVNRGLHEVLDGRYEIVVTQLDVKRFPAPGRESAMLTTISSKIAMSQARLVIAIDDYAYRFCVKHQEQLGTGIPIVFGGVNFWDGNKPAGVTGVVETIDLRTCLALARHLQPEAKRVVVVNDPSETGKANWAALEKIRSEGFQLPMMLLGSGTFEQTEASLRRLSREDDIVLLLSWNIDSQGRARSYEDAIVRARALSAAPLYGPWDFYMGKGIVGGSILDSRIHGNEVAELAAKVLGGVSVDSLPVVTSCRWKLAVDERELMHHGIDRDLVPEGVLIEFSHPSLLYEYRLQLFLVSLLILVQGVTIWVLLLSRRSRRRAEQSLRESEENLRVMLSSIGDAVVATDSRGLIVLMNPVAEQLSGRSSGEALGQPHFMIFELVQNESDSPTVSAIAQTLKTGEPQQTLRPLSLRHLNGSVRRVVVSAAPLRIEGAEKPGVVAVIRDVSEHLRLEEQLQQVQKTESVGLLASGVAHDFNNLLQIIKGNLELLADQHTDAAEARECSAQIGEAVDKASDLTRQLLAFGRRQKLNVQPQDIAELIENFMKMMRRIIGETIELRYKAEHGRFCALVDKHQIEQVLLNLCVNARDAMPEGGLLEIGLDEMTFTDEDAERQVMIRAGHFLQISVSDTGVGMSRETLARVFDPFFTTKAMGKGTGLGLSVVQGIVAQHKGFISVYSELGQGTTFRIYLPYIKGQISPVKETVAAVMPPASGTQKGLVLYAEDDRELRLTTIKLLHRYGFEVQECADGLEAFGQATQLERDFTVAILDSVMPRMGGVEAAHKIRELRPTLPIILCSGYLGQSVDKSADLADFHCLSKPYPAEALITLIRQCSKGRGN